MTPVPPPLSSIYDLSDLSDGGAEIAVVANAGQRAKLAEWAGVDAVEQFDATVNLRRQSPVRFGYEAELTAKVIQSCVVTLEPVHSTIGRHISRSLHLVHGPAARRAHEDFSGDVAVADDLEEELATPKFDLVGPLLEEFTLAIDPYPRAPGVVFEAPSAEERGESPFAVLKSMAKPSK